MKRSGIGVTHGESLVKSVSRFYRRILHYRWVVCGDFNTNQPQPVLTICGTSPTNGESGPTPNEWRVFRSPLFPLPERLSCAFFAYIKKRIASIH
jgi:hypothetical protein